MGELRDIRKHFSKLGGTYLLFALIANGVQILEVILIREFAPGLLTNSAVSLVLSMLPLYVIATPVCCLLLRRLPASEPEKRSLKAHQFLGFLVVGFAAMYIGNMLGLIVTSLIGIVKGSAVNNDLVNLITGTDMWGTVLVAVIIAPIVEELLFRKLLIDRVRRFGEGVAVILSGFLFGLFHGNLNQFFYAFFLGMIFGVVYIRTGRILYTVIMHMIVNFFGSVVALLVVNAIDLEAIEKLSATDPAQLMADAEGVLSNVLPSLILYGVYLIFLFGMLIAGILVFVMNKKKIRLSAGEWEASKKEKRKVVICNLGMILYIVFWVAMMVIQFMS